VTSLEFDGYDGDANAWRIGASINSIGEHGFTLFTKLARRLNYYGAYQDRNWTAVQFSQDRKVLEETMKFLRENADRNPQSAKASEL
jgi:hypothetical protein